MKGDKKCTTTGQLTLYITLQQCLLKLLLYIVYMCCALCACALHCYYMDSYIVVLNYALILQFQLRRVVAIAVGAGNYAAAKSLVDARGGPVSISFESWLTWVSCVYV